MQKRVNVIIVGSGPIGLETAANLTEAGLSCIVFDSGCLAETIARWPEGATFFSSPERCAIAGIPIQNTHQAMLNREEYLSYLRQVVEIYRIPLKLFHQVQSIYRSKNEFEVRTAGNTGKEIFYSSYIVLATGNMARPRKLGIPGEQLKHVSHSLSSVHRYFQQKLLIVGGRNSAVESAIRCWRAGAEVTISYRGAGFEKSKLNSRYHLEISILTRKGKIGFLARSHVEAIESDKILLRNESGLFEQHFDFVLVQTGFDADLSLMKKAGVEFHGEENIPCFNPDTLETNVPGLFIAGTATGGGQKAHKIFVATSHHHGVAITKQITGKPGSLAGSLPARSYDFDNSDISPAEGGQDNEASSPAEPLS